MKKKRLSFEKRHQQIIEKATEIFSEKGFKGTTTRDIAEKSLISEAMLYRHFERKSDLYREIIDTRCNEQETPLIPPELVAKKDDCLLLRAIALELIKRIENHPDFMRLFLFSALEGHELSSIFLEERILKLFDTLSHYFKQGIKEGKFKRLNPGLAARAFIGMIIYYGMVQEIFGGKGFKTFKRGEVVENFVAIFLGGIVKKKGER